MEWQQTSSFCHKTTDGRFSIKLGPDGYWTLRDDGNAVSSTDDRLTIEDAKELAKMILDDELMNADDCQDHGSPQTPNIEADVSKPPETSFEKNVRELREQYPNMVLLFQTGDFCELFDGDALIAENVFGASVTRRGNKTFAGFPCQVLEDRLGKLLAAGYRAALVEQVPGGGQDVQELVFETEDAAEESTPVHADDVAFDENDEPSEEVPPNPEQPDPPEADPRNFVQDPQTVVDELCFKHGVSVAKFADWDTMLQQHGVDPDGITAKMITKGVQNAERRLVGEIQWQDADGGDVDGIATYQSWTSTDNRWEIDRASGEQPQFTLSLDGTIVATDLPTLRKAFDAAEKYLRDGEGDPAVTGKQATEGTETGKQSPTKSIQSKQDIAAGDVGEQGKGESDMSEAAVLEQEALRVPESRARRLLEALGKDVGKWTLKRLNIKLGTAEGLAETLSGANDLADGKDKLLLNSISGALQDDRKVEVVTDAAEEPVTVPKKRGRPKKIRPEVNGEHVNGTAKKPAIRKNKTERNNKPTASGFGPREGSIASIILNAFRDGPVGKESVHKVLTRKFPDHSSDSLKDTINWHLSSSKGVVRKAGLTTVKNDDGTYLVK